VLIIKDDLASKSCKVQRIDGSRDWLTSIVKARR
jgi:hypothetical protein